MSFTDGGEQNQLVFLAEAVLLLQSFEVKMCLASPGCGPSYLRGAGFICSRDTSERMP